MANVPSPLGKKLFASIGPGLAACSGLSTDDHRKILMTTKRKKVGRDVLLGAAVCGILFVVVAVFQHLRHQSRIAATEAARKAEENALKEEERLHREDLARKVEEKANAERLQKIELSRQAETQAIEQKQLLARQKIEQQALAEETEASALRAYKARYLGEQPAQRRIVVLIVNEDGKPNAVLGNAFVSLLKTNGFDSTATFFTAEFVSDGLFAQTIEGSKAAIDKLELKALTDTLLLGQQKVEYSTDPALNNLVTAHMALQFRTIPLNSGRQEHVENLETVGAELGQATQARALAEARMSKRVQANSNNLLSSLKATVKQP